MGFSLRKGYGLDNKSLSGDFASKMWASYTQLNPGVYSEAIATEFKRRMKPDYVDSEGTGYYYNTFGPSGLNKATADWIYLLTCSGDLVSRTISKIGVMIKWNLDGTIVTQNNIPAYTKGSNSGIITISSTDGWTGVNSATFASNTFNGYFPNVKFVNATSINIGTNALLRSGDSYLSLDLGNFSALSNLYTTAMVDATLSYYNTFYSSNTPIKNLTLNLGGATMGIPTGAGNNADLLGILAKFTAAGFTATIIVRTV